MPYRRLPNTDSARLKALKIAYEQGQEIPPFKLAFSQSTLQKVRSFLPSFEKVHLESRKSYEAQVDKNKQYIRAMKKARLYISHFIQVVNMAIYRGDLNPNERTFFHLDEDEKKTPALTTEQELIEWGERLIKGEEKRRSMAKTPITNPTIAVVRVRYEQFIDAYKFQKTLQKNHLRSQENLINMRPTADSIILDIWNEVESYFEELSENEKREKAQEYGLVYVYRKSELEKAANH